MKSHTVFKDTLHNGLEIEKYLNKNIFICMYVNVMHQLLPQIEKI